MTKKSKILLHSVSKTFAQSKQDKIVVIKNVNFEFDQGRSYGLSGVSGTGKSTLINIIAGLESPDSGKVEYQNLTNREIGLVFQYPYLIPELTVIENVILKGLIAGRSIYDCKQEGLDLLKSVGILEKSESSTGALSGGQQQRVSICRAIFNKPKFLFADEPTAHLDKDNSKQIIDLLLKAKDKWGMGLIVTSHDPEITSLMENVLEISNGNLVKQK